MRATLRAPESANRSSPEPIKQTVNFTSATVNFTSKAGELCQRRQDIRLQIFQGVT
jgi:hypothetical protein